MQVRSQPECLLRPPPLLSRLLQPSSLPTCERWVPGLAPKHLLPSIDWGFIFKKKAKHIFNCRNQMERALLRQRGGHKTQRADGALPMRGPGAPRLLSPPLQDALAGWGKQ